MAATLTFNARAAAQFAESTVRDAVTFTLPQVASTDTLMTAATAEFTGTSSNTMAIGSAGSLAVNGTNQVDPITGVNLDFDDYWFFGMVVGRSNESNTPTGTVNYSSNGFGGLTTNGLLTAGDNYSIFIRHAIDRTATNGNTLTVDLTGTTGYKVSVMVAGQTD